MISNIGNYIIADTRPEEEAQKQAEELMKEFRKENPGAESYVDQCFNTNWGLKY